MPNDPLIIAGRSFRSRLMVGTGKFPSAAALKAALEASEAEIVTVALRRVDLGKPAGDSILSVLDPKKYLILPNTSGARTADEAVRLVPPILMTLESAVEFIADDELVEITPKSIRLRKRFLKEHERKRANRDETA